MSRPERANATVQPNPQTSFSLPSHFVLFVRSEQDHVRTHVMDVDELGRNVATAIHVRLSGQEVTKNGPIPTADHDRVRLDPIVDKSFRMHEFDGLAYL